MCQVLPSICTEERITLGAELEDGTVVRGQNSISHPTATASSGGGNGAPAAVPRGWHNSAAGGCARTPGPQWHPILSGFIPFNPQL